MQTPTQALLSQLLDYAGLFPPAKLPLEEALSNFLDYQRESPHAWMLGRFVCPVARLREVVELVREPRDAARLRITILGQQSSSADHFFAQLDADLCALEDFRRAWGWQGIVDMFEVALPKDEPAEALDAPFAKVAYRLSVANVRGFFEVPQQPSWQEKVEQVSMTLSHASQVAGLKLRCGGLTADAFPSAEQVAFFLLRCRELALSWKATAGLHHPYPFWDESLQVWQHGFLNLFGASVLGLSRPLREDALMEILTDREGRHFRFDADEIAWKDWKCSLDQLIDARRRRVLSFGSCSFEEPCRDLRALGLI